MSKSNKDIIDLFLEHDINLKTRTIYLGMPMYNEDEGDPGVDHVMAAKLIKNMHVLESENSNPITIILNTPGGDVYQAMAIYNTIRASPCVITIIGRGIVMSAGSIIMQAADKGRRILAPDAVFMIHEGSEGYGSDHPRNIKNWVKFNEKYTKLTMDKILFEAMSEKDPSLKQKRFEELMKFDTILTAKEAIDLGLADKLEYDPDQDRK